MRPSNLELQQILARLSAMRSPARAVILEALDSDVRSHALSLLGEGSGQASDMQLRFNREGLSEWFISLLNEKDAISAAAREFLIDAADDLPEVRDRGARWTEPTP